MFWIISFFGCILTVAFATIAAAVVMRTTSAQAEQALNLETSRTNVRMEEYFDKAMQVLALAGELPVLAEDPRALSTSPAAREDLAEELDRLRERFAFLYMYFGLESDGSLIIADYDEPEEFDARSRPWYLQARAEDGIAVTEPYLDAATDVWIASVSREVQHRGEATGVLALDISLDAIAEMVFSGSDYFPSLRNLIVSDAGEILIAAEQELIGRPFSPAQSSGAGPAAGLLGGASAGELSRVSLEGEEYFAALQPNDPTGFVLVSIIDPAEISGPAIRILFVLLMITALVLGLYIIVMNRIVGSMITMPVMEIAEDMRRIETLQLEDTIEPNSRTYEIHLMQTSIEMMKRSLRSFRRYVPSDVVTLLFEQHAEAALGADKRELTLFFSDIAGFTGISESMDPDSLAEYLGHYFRGVTAVLQDRSGTVDKFIGDAIMAFWGAPLEVPNHAELACHAALECQEFLRQARSDGLLPGFHTRIGINTGEAVVGNMGYEERMSYTAIGDSVNVASRFEGLNKYYGTSIVVTEATRRQAGDEFLFRKLDTVVVKGKRSGHTVHELVGCRDRLSAEDRAYHQRFAEAVEAYDARNWKQAALLLRSIRRPERPDKPRDILLKRCLRFVSNPPPADWQGEVYLREK